MAEEDGKVKFVAIILRNGDVSPSYIPPMNFTYDWAESPGELTTKGLLESYYVGSYLRRRYNQEQELYTLDLTKEYENFFVRSIQHPRYLQTIEAAIRGMFDFASSKENLFQYIPIVSNPPSRDHVLQAYDNCPLIPSIQATLRRESQWIRWLGSEGISSNMVLVDKIFGIKPQLENWRGKRHQPPPTFHLCNLFFFPRKICTRHYIAQIKMGFQSTFHPT